MGEKKNRRFYVALTFFCNLSLFSFNICVRQRRLIYSATSNGPFISQKRSSLEWIVDEAPFVYQEMDRVTRTIWLGRDKRELTDQSRGAFEEKKIKNDGHVGQSSLRLRRRRLTRLVHRSMNRAAVSLLLMGGVGVGVEWPAASASRLGRYQTAAVSSEDGGCSRIGRRALADGGSAVDAAVAVLFCIGVVHSQAAGIGGGSVFTVYEAAAGRARVLDARETAPQAATEDMFGGNITAALIGFSLFPFGSLSLSSLPVAKVDWIHDPSDSTTNYSKPFRCSRPFFVDVTQSP